MPEPVGGAEGVVPGSACSTWYPAKDSTASGNPTREQTGGTLMKSKVAHEGGTREKRT